MKNPPLTEVSLYRDTWVEVNLDAIYKNVTRIKSIIPKGVEIFAVVKANAYGHGAVQVANTALAAGATRLAVAFLDEALVLRRAGIQSPILVLGPSRPEDVNVAAENDITLTVFQKEWIEIAKKVKVLVIAPPIERKKKNGLLHCLLDMLMVGYEGCKDSKFL